MKSLRCVMALLMVITVAACAGGDGGQGSTTGAPAKVGSGPNVLIITIDTLRADHLPMYGYDQVQTPNLAAFASEGVVFRQTFSHAPITLPSHTSIMSGTFPIFHGVRNNGNFFVPEKLNTIAEMYKNAGYDTAAFVSAVILDSKFKIDQGFDVYDDNINRANTTGNIFMVRDRRAELTLEEAMKWIKGRKSPEGKPFFIWVHLYDPHQAYNPPEPFRTIYQSNQYDGEIAYADQEIGKFFNFLKSKKLYDQSLISITADHGESLGDHGEVTHGFYIYNSTTWVPWILKLPGSANKGTVIDELTRHVDIVPTLLDISAAKNSVDPALMKDIQGVSLFGLIKGDENNLRLLTYAEAFLPHDYHGWAMPRFLRSNDRKFIWLPTAEFFDEEKDFPETANLFSTDNEEAAKYQTKLEEFVATYSKGGFDAASVELDEETMQDLIALGYIHGKADLTAANDKDYLDGPDPKDKIDIFQKMQASRQLISNKQFDKALVMIDELVADNPKDHQTRSLRANCLARLDRPDEAEAEYVSILKENPSDIGAYVGLANFLIGRDRLEDAEKQIDAAMALQPNELQLWVVRGELEIARGEIDKAIEYFEEARSRGETSLAVFLGIGQALTMKGENKKAAKVFREGLAVNQDSPEVHFNIALVEEQMGNDDLAEIHYLLALQRGLTQTGMAHNNLGGIYARQGKIRDAVLEFRKALAYNPDHLHALFNLAHLLFTSGGYMEAKKLYIRALNIAPDLVPAHRELSMVDQLLGDWEGAFISERAISRIVPTDPTPWLNMAQIKMKLNQSEEARKYLDAAISRGGKGIMTVIEKDKSLSPLLPKPIPKANDSEQTSQDPRNPEKTETSGDGTSSGNGDSPQQ